MGDRSDSSTYVRMKLKAAVEANIASWMDAGAARRRLRQERHQRRWIIALAFIQLLQASLLAGLLLR